MRRVALLTSVLTLGLAAPSAAWVELKPYAVPHDGVADCLRAAGPGQLALLGHLGRTTAATDLFSVGPTGFTRASSTTLGWLQTCAEAAGAPGVSPLLVAPVVRDRHSRGSRLRVAVAGGAPTTLAPAASLDAPPSVAVAPSGAAVVAWEQIGNAGGLRVLAAVRPAANAPFGPPATLGEDPPGNGSPRQVIAPVAAINATGVATVVWVSGTSGNGGGVLHVASTTGDGRFAASQAVASASGAQLGLAVSPGGGVLVADYGGDLDSIVAYERAPGASAFVPVPVPVTGSASDAAFALADDGSSVIAYHSDGNAVFALLRRPGGIFGSERLIAGQRPDGSSSSSSGGFGFNPGGSGSHHPTPPDDQTGGQMTAALGAGGRVLVTWTEPGDASGATSVRAASGTLAGGLGHAARLGGPCRAANAARPLPLADGTLAAAWTDNARVDSQDDEDTPLAGGLLHVAVPGAAAPSVSAPPGLSARLLGPLVLHGGDDLRLRVRCRRGPCVVRASATAYGLGSPNSGLDGMRVAGSASLPRGRSGLIRLAGSGGTSFARSGRAPATISLQACSATGAGITRLTLREPLRRRPARPLPRILDLVARRHGSRIRVTWRTSVTRIR